MLLTLSFGEAKMELFDYIEVFYNQRRRYSILGQISPAEFENARVHSVWIPWKTAKNEGFPPAPHASISYLWRTNPNQRRSTYGNRPLNRIRASATGGLDVAPKRKPEDYVESRGW